MSAITNHQVVVVSGETGSGKTTQLPKICLALGRGVRGVIGHTQPRRLAARTVAERIAEELGTELGGLVGYQVRFTDQTDEMTMVKLMTDGILLNEIGSDPLLRDYDTIIVDEAHERSLNIDFILGYLATLLPKRPDLRVIVTSATIDAERFAQHFSDHVRDGRVPIISVSGRTYPVEVRYRPLDISVTDSTRGYETAADSSTRDPDGLSIQLDETDGILAAVDELTAAGPGDILVFLAGERDIHDTANALAGHLGPRYTEPGATSKVPGAIEVLPLFARLSPAEQRRVFTPHNLRRIVLSTNIAETSLTVPGIRYVIDTGVARISRYSTRTRVQRLPIEEISQASANQRSGRCGRVADGIAIRLYSRDNYEARPEYTDPEILRTTLASVILQMKALRLGEISEFPFLDPPAPRAISDGMAMLRELGALRKDGQLTPVGRRLAHLPMDPHLGRIILAAEREHCIPEILVIVAALSMQDVRIRPEEDRDIADSMHRRFVNPESDFLTYLTLWRYLNVQRNELSGTRFRRLCQREYLHYLRVREWMDLVGQYRGLIRGIGISAPALSLGVDEGPISTGSDGRGSLGTHGERVEHSAAELRRSKARLSGAAAQPHPASESGAGAGDSSGGPGNRPTGVIERAAALTERADYPALHRALLVGMLTNIGLWSPVRRIFEGARGVQFRLWPGTGINRPDWVMCAELVETTRLYARNAARIEPEWVEQVASHLLKWSYSEPYWSSRNVRAQVRARASLYGVPVVAERTVALARLTSDTAKSYGHSPGKNLSAPAAPNPDRAQKTPANVALARSMFIEHALVAGEWNDRKYRFLAHNRHELQRVMSAAERARDPRLILDETARYRFFDERLGAEVTDPASFNKWWKTLKNHGVLAYPDGFLYSNPEARTATEVPEYWTSGEMSFPISYRFDPGAEDDGMTVTIPLQNLGSTDPGDFEWLLPGMLTELVTELIKGLPKETRRNLVPLGESGQRLADFMERGLREGLAELAQERSRVAAQQAAELEDALNRLATWAGVERETTTGDPDRSRSRDPDRMETVTKMQEHPSLFDAFRIGLDQLFAQPVSAEQFAAAVTHLPAYLRIRFQITDGRRVVATGRDLAELRRALKPPPAEPMSPPEPDSTKKPAPVRVHPPNTVQTAAGDGSVKTADATQTDSTGNSGSPDSSEELAEALSRLADWAGR